MIPNSSISGEFASQRQRDMLAQAQRERLGQRIKAEAAAAHAQPPEPRRRLHRVLRAAFGLSGR
jgi:hypothetical protein